MQNRLWTSPGIYALISDSVNQRAREIGICIALGASQGLVQREVFAKTLRLALAGVALGTLASFVLTKWIESLLFATTPRGPGGFLRRDSASVCRSIGRWLRSSATSFTH
jgi:ABC-type lipoprotein release transport system permease subunit